MGKDKGKSTCKGSGAGGVSIQQAKQELAEADKLFRETLAEAPHRSRDPQTFTASEERAEMNFQAAREQRHAAEVRVRGLEKAARAARDDSGDSASGASSRSESSQRLERVDGILVDRNVMDRLGMKHPYDFGSDDD
jgi:hypothetical protein